MSYPSAPGGQLTFPTRVGMKAGIFAPVVAGEAIEIPDDKTVTDGHLADEFLITCELAAEAVYKTKLSFFKAEEGDVCVGADGELTEFFVMNFASGI